MTNSSQVAARELKVQPICTLASNGKKKKVTASPFQMNLCHKLQPSNRWNKSPVRQNTTPLIPNNKKKKMINKANPP